MSQKEQTEGVAVLEKVLQAHLTRTNESLRSKKLDPEERAFLETLKRATEQLIKAIPAKKPSARFGNPLLPGCEPRLLVPIETKWGNLQVYPIHELETHGLKFLDRFTCAMHPNAYSMHELATRIVAFWEGRAPIGYPMDQLEYIQQCGGLTTQAARMQEHIEDARRANPES